MTKKPADAPAVLAVREGQPAAAPAADDPVSGDWKGTGGQVSFTMHLTLGLNNAVTGTIDSEQGGGNSRYVRSCEEGAEPHGTDRKWPGRDDRRQDRRRKNDRHRERHESDASPAGGAGRRRGRRGAGAKPGDAARNLPCRQSLSRSPSTSMGSRPGPCSGQAGPLWRLTVNDRNQLVFVRIASEGRTEIRASSCSTSPMKRSRSRRSRPARPPWTSRRTARSC